MVGEHRFYGIWNDNKKKLDITLLEFYRIGLVLKVWNHIFKKISEFILYLFCVRT